MTIWITSDLHIDHEKMVTVFTLEDGSPARKFSSGEEMAETIIQRWNSVVREGDHVYVLGDVAMRKAGLLYISRLKGKKRLVRGNHDILKTKDYLSAGFQEIHGCRVLDNMLFTHIPVHPLSLGRFRGNVHGHTHMVDIPGPYLNVCVEKTNYYPITLEETKSRLEKKKETLDGTFTSIEL